MKKIALILSFILIFSVILVGCDNSDSYTEKESNNQETTDVANNNGNKGNSTGGIHKPSFTGEITYENLINAEPSPKTDFSYNRLEDGTVEIYHYKGNSEVIVVPILINNEKVTSILRSTFKGATSAQAILIPATVKTLDGTFENLPNLKIVVCDGVKKCINKPFNESENVTVYCKQGSFMHNYTKSRKINFELVEETTTESTTETITS